MHGVLVLNKPSGTTSRKMVDRVEAWFPDVAAGHAGTLDPLATGVLVVCVGNARRLIEYVQRMQKSYHAVIRLGARSDTDDALGTVTPVAGAGKPTEDQVRSALAAFVGEIEQKPPAVSAAHVDGERAHELARRGEEVDLAPRRVRIDRIEVLHYAYPDAELVIDCGKGTYIRSIARDLGEKLGCGGFVKTLQRRRIGPFRIEKALPADADAAAAAQALLPPGEAVSELAAVHLEADQVRKLCAGQTVPFPSPAPDWGDQEVAAHDADGNFIAVALLDAKKGELRPLKVLA
jgi:tRNA pseudouridine55 synthase